MGPGAGAMASVVAGAPLWRQQDRQAMGLDRPCGGTVFSHSRVLPGSSALGVLLTL